MAFELFNLAGRRALVTGSSQGIGLAIARGLAEHGASVVLNGRDRNKLDAAAASVRACGHDVAVTSFDVTRAEAVRGGVLRIEEAIGPIGILVNNAGMQFRTPSDAKRACGTGPSGRVVSTQCNEFPHARARRLDRACDLVAQGHGLPNPYRAEATMIEVV